VANNGCIIAVDATFVEKVPTFLKTPTDLVGR
jgi:hypothetical protein